MTCSLAGTPLNYTTKIRIEVIQIIKIVQNKSSMEYNKNIISHLDVGAGVDLVHCISWGTSCLPVQVITLHKHCMIAKATHPHVTFPFTLQLHPFTNVKSKARKEGKKQTEKDSKKKCKSLHILLVYFSKTMDDVLLSHFI